jgi:hypothetical protein
MKNVCILTLFFVGLVWMISCENPSEFEFKPKLVVNGELIAGYPIDSIFVTWSAEITVKYDTEQQRVRNADVRLNGVPLLEYEYLGGVYYYPDTTYRVEYGETYQLQVQAGDQSVSSETTVPETFQFSPIGVVEGDTVQYIPSHSFFSDAFFTLTWPGYQGSLIYRVVSLAKEATLENFIEDDRTEADVFKGDEEDRENPSIWWVADEYARVNWMYFNWTGWHDIIVSAVDENYYNYRNGVLFGEQSGQNFNPVVEGGYGLFCSAASDTLSIFIVE